MKHLQSAFGLLTLVAIAWLFRENRAALAPRFVALALGAQLLIALMVLKKSVVPRLLQVFK
jgi:CNT family concentrative nucleoside transporter